MQKADVWTEAEALGLPADELKESQEICFVSQGDYRTFIETEMPAAKNPGAFVDEKGDTWASMTGLPSIHQGNVVASELPRGSGSMCSKYSPRPIPSCSARKKPCVVPAVMSKISISSTDHFSGARTMSP